MSRFDRSIDCWKIQASEEVFDEQSRELLSHNWTLFYDKKTGIRLSAVFTMLNPDGDAYFSYGDHLVNTNALIG